MNLKNLKNGQAQALILVYVIIVLVYVVGIIGSVQSWCNAVVAANSFPPEIAFFIEIMPFLLLLFIVVGGAVAVGKVTQPG